MADDGVETDKEDNYYGEDKKVSARIGQEKLNRKRKRRSKKDKYGLVAIPCFEDGCDHQFKFWDDFVTILPKKSNGGLDLGVYWGYKTIQWRNQE